MHFGKYAFILSLVIKLPITARVVYVNLKGLSYVEYKTDVLIYQKI